MPTANWTTQTQILEGWRMLMVFPGSPISCDATKGVSSSICLVPRGFVWWAYWLRGWPETAPSQVTKLHGNVPSHAEEREADFRPKVGQAGGSLFIFKTWEAPANPSAMEEIPSETATPGGRNLKRDHSIVNGTISDFGFPKPTNLEQNCQKFGKSPKKIMEKINFSSFLIAILGVASKNPYLNRTKPY